MTKKLNKFFHEHSITNLIRLNFHKVDKNFYRSAQPSPKQLEKIIKKYKIKTIINLRGAEKISILEKERAICKKLNVNLIEIKYHSRGIPSYETIKNTKKLLESIEYPVLIHCKAGSDRTGLVATLYLYFIKNIPINKAIKQLNFFPYGHIKYGKTGLIDFYFEEFIKSKEENLLLWHEKINKKELEKRFKNNTLFDFILDKVLKRE